MNEHFFRISELINKKLWGQLTALEEEELRIWEKKYPIIKKWSALPDNKRREIEEKAYDLSKLDYKNEWNRVEQKVSIKPQKSRFYWIAAASVILTTLFGLMHLPDSKEFQNTSSISISAKETILPATNKAYVTLSNGEKVLLQGDKENEFKDGDLLLSTNNGILNYTGKDGSKTYEHTIEVPPGATFFVQLHDGTKVWLNADSKLIYPSKFSNSQRLVKVKGEAYFEVAKDPQKPFKVLVDGTEVEALGTAFNINTHLLEGSVKTILTSGKIKVTAHNRKEIIDCDCSAISNSEGIEVGKANLEEALAWKDGFFYFNGRTLLEIVQEVSRWYDLELEYKPSKKNNIRYKGGIKRTEDVQLICQVLENLSGQKINLLNRKLIVN